MKKQFPPPLSVACIFNQIYKCKACNVADPPRNLPDLDLTLEEETSDPYPIREKKSILTSRIPNATFFGLTFIFMTVNSDKIQIRPFRNKSRIKSQLYKIKRTGSRSNKLPGSTSLRPFLT